MANNRDDFSEGTKEVIASRVGYKCCFPTCRVETRGPHTNAEKKVSIGEAAHITAAAPGGARYDDSLTKGQRKSAENGIWMCRTHARLVDSDEAEYPVELLKSWKAQAEYEQYCILNNINGEGKRQKRYNKALRKINKSIEIIHDIYNTLNEYYNENLSMFNNFIEVNIKIMEMWYLYGSDVSKMIKNLTIAKNEFGEVYSKYRLDISEELNEKLNQYFNLTVFAYDSDGDVGMYNNYYEKLFETLHNNYDLMTKAKNEIDQIIQEEYEKNSNE